MDLPSTALFDHPTSGALAAYVAGAGAADDAVEEAAVAAAPALGAKFGVELESTALFDHPTSGALVEYLCGQMGGGGDAVGEAARAAAAPRAAAPAVGGPVACVAAAPRRVTLAPSMALVLAGPVCTGPGVGELALRGGAANSRNPATRARGVEPPIAAGRYGAFAFQGAFPGHGNAFAISVMEARVMDPQHSLVLEGAYAACRVPGGRQALSNAMVGFFLGMGGLSSFAPGNADAKASTSIYEGTAFTLSVASGRVSYALGLTGPCFAADTACSSALIALHSGYGALSLGECPRAVATGISLITASVTAAFGAAGMLSERGRCHTLDLNADGYCRGEGCGSFLLAADDYAVDFLDVAGTAVQQDGPSASLTAPNGSSQQRLLATLRHPAALLVALEAHGTGTALGDPIELRRLNGHVNSFVAKKDAPLSLPVEASGRRGAAGRLSSFGFSGTIAHGLFLPAFSDAYAPAPLAGAASLYRKAAMTKVVNPRIKRATVPRDDTGPGTTRGPARPAVEVEAVVVEAVVEEAAVAEAGGEAAVATPAELRAMVLACYGDVAEADLINDDATFETLGVDSLASVELRNAIAKKTGVEVDNAVILSNPTLQAVVDAVVDGAAVLAAPRRRRRARPARRRARPKARRWSSRST
ncbi:hypothetical protein JL721_957 [Aureococcus anophagefferens]|nr:hypothetical protein JL721_957 [Aureococcus anophagefferens]